MSRIKPELASMIKTPFLPDLGLFLGKHRTWTEEEFEILWDIVKGYTPFKITQEMINETFLNIKEEPVKGAVGPRDIEKAKAVPIDTLLEFKNNLALCLWHNEQHSSMRYYSENNRAWCFSCSNGGDSIDVVMKLKDFSFNEAVNFLCRKQ